MNYVCNRAVHFIEAVTDPGGQPPLFLDQTEARKGQYFFF